MIIFGTSAKRKTIGKGEFYCPRCRTQRLYERKQAKQYFSVYFIPLIPLGDLGEFIECQTCHLTFEPDVLKVKPPVEKLSLAELLNSLKSLLEDGMPVEYLLRDLTAAGVERDTALQTLNAQIKHPPQLCSDCGLSYTNSITHCSECHKPLESNG